MDRVPESVLIINVTRIGDTLFATPAIRAIATAWPNARITVLGHPKRIEVIRNLPFVAVTGGITKRSALWKGWLGGKQYDYAFVYGFDQELVAYASRVSDRVVAFRQADEKLNGKLFRVVECEGLQQEHAVAQALRLPAAAGVSPAGLRLSFALTDDERREARQRLDREGVASRRPLVGLQVASFATKAYRDWPIESFAQLCKAMLARWPESRFLIFGGPDEHERTAWLKQELGEAAVLLAGKAALDLRSTAALMANCDLYVGVDTGPTHIMSCFDVPIVGLYHCLHRTDRYGPLDHPLNFCLDHPRAGGACDESVSMGELSVEAVLDRVTEALRTRSLAPAS